MSIQVSPALPYTRRWGTSRWPSRRLPPDTWCRRSFSFLSPFPVPPFCLSPVLGKSFPQFLIQIPIQLEILNLKFLILNSFLFSPVRKIFFSYWESDFLRAFQSHDKGTTRAGGNHTIPYVTIRFHTISHVIWQPGLSGGSPRWGAVSLTSPSDCPSCRIFPSIFGRDAWIRLHLRAISGERKVLERWTGACLLRLLRAKTAYISCLSPDFACLEGWICWCCTSFLYVCLIRWCNVNYWLSAFERELEQGEPGGVTVVTVVTIKFQGVTILLFVIYIYLIYK